jgi:hypothetical protein
MHLSGVLFKTFGLQISDIGFVDLNPQSRVPSGCRNPQSPLGS